jgi:CspA family cold shock protein
VSEKETGIVKWFNATKGYGFIERDLGGDVFVHYTSIVGGGFRTLEDGERVEFTVVEGEKGPQAQEVVPVGVS